jgi:putative peptidoglycan lipid II flippase
MVVAVTGSKSIAMAALVVSAGVLLSRMLGYVRTLLLAGMLGVGADTDLYAAAFTIPDILFFLMAGGYLSITLVPLLAGHVQSGDRRAAGEVFTAVFRVVLGIMVVLTAILIAAAHPITAAVFPEITGDDLDRLVAMMRVTFASQVFFMAGTMFMAAQYAHRRFLIPTLAPLIYNVGIILGGVVGGWVGDPSPEAFIWGGFAGAAIGNFAIQMWGARRSGVWFTGGTPLWSRAVPEYFTLAFPLMIGQSAVALDESWPRIFGQFAGEEAISELYFARTLNMLPVGVIAQAAGVAAYPFLAGLVAEGNLEQFRATVVRSVRATVAVGGLAAGLVVALAVPIVGTAFEYGRFDADDTRAVGGLLAIFAVTIPFWAAHQVYTRAFYAQRRMWTPVIIGTAVTVAVVPVLWVAVNRLGAPGVALGSTIGLVCYTLAIAISWHRSGSDGGAVLAAAARTLAASVVAGLTAFGIAMLLDGSPSVVRGVVAAPAGAAVYLLAGRLFGLAEVAAVIGRLRRIGRA